MSMKMKTKLLLWIAAFLAVLTFGFFEHFVLFFTAVAFYYLSAPYFDSWKFRV
jgi:hypothetical protein